MATADTLAWSARWKAVRPNAQYNESFGLESAWRANFDAWGYPLEDAEQDVDYNGWSMKGRTFSKIGLVVWKPASGAEVIGFP